MVVGKADTGAAICDICVDVAAITCANYRQFQRDQAAKQRIQVSNASS